MVICLEMMNIYGGECVPAILTNVSMPVTILIGN